MEKALAATEVMTAATFAELPPEERGFVVYMLGCRDDEPHVPDEKNPYPIGSYEENAWFRGQQRAVLLAQDVP